MSVKQVHQMGGENALLMQRKSIENTGPLFIREKEGALQREENSYLEEKANHHDVGKRTKSNDLKGDR